MSYNITVMGSSPPNSPKVEQSAVADSTANTDAKAVQHESEDNQMLLLKTEVVPTCSRFLHGLRDLGLIVLAAIPFVLMKLVRFTMARLGVSEHRWKGVPNDVPITPVGRERVSEVVAVLKSGALNKSILLQTDNNRIGPAATAILGHLYEVLNAMETVCQQNNIQLTEAQKAEVHIKLAQKLVSISQLDAVNPQDVHKDLRKAGKKCLMHIINTTGVPGLKLSR